MDYFLEGYEDVPLCLDEVLHLLESGEITPDNKLRRGTQSTFVRIRFFSEIPKARDDSSTNGSPRRRVDSLEQRKAAGETARAFVATSMANDDVVVTDVPEGSVGARAGLRPGDVIEEYDFQKIRGSMSDLLSLLPKTAGRDKVKVFIYRDNRPMTLEAPGGGLGIRIAEARMSNQGGAETMNRKQVVGGAIAFVAGVVVFAIGQSIYSSGHDTAMFESARRGEALMQLANIVRFGGIGVAAIGAIIAMVTFLKAGTDHAGDVSPRSAWTDGPPPREQQFSAASSPAPAAAPPQGGGDELRKCPFCAEWIKKEAIRCRFCHSELSAGGSGK